MKKTADFLIDYHNTWTDSISFVFRDRVLYRADENKAENQKAAEGLSERLAQMLRAYGHTIVNEFPVAQYIEHDLHRSTSGAALLLGRIPAFTAELSTGHMPNPAITRAAVAGTRNVLRWAGMLADDPEPIEEIELVNLDFPMRRTNTVRAPVTCVALHLVEAGDIVQAGTPLAELRDIWGRLLPQSPLRAARPRRLRAGARPRHLLRPGRHRYLHGNSRFSAHGWRLSRRLFSGTCICLMGDAAAAGKFGATGHILHQTPGFSPEQWLPNGCQYAAKAWLFQTGHTFTVE
jgi:hypothetical protein